MMHAVMASNPGLASQPKSMFRPADQRQVAACAAFVHHGGILPLSLTLSSMGERGWFVGARI